MPAKKTKRWVAKVKTDSTHPPEGLFTKSAATIARTLASKKVSPKGPASGMRMLNYFINRGGRSQRLPPRRTRKSQGSAFKANTASKSAKACCLRSYNGARRPRPPRHFGTAALRVMFKRLGNNTGFTR